MKNKIFKLGLFSLLSLGALATTSGVFSNKGNDVCYETSNKAINASSDSETNKSVTTEVLDSDKTYYDTKSISSDYVLDLNGHVMLFDYHGTRYTRGLNIENSVADTTINVTIKDSNPNSIHHYDIDEETGRWIINENGKHTVRGGVIASAMANYPEEWLIYVRTSDSTAKLNFNMIGGTICGAGSNGGALDLYGYEHENCLGNLKNVSIQGNNNKNTINVIQAELTLEGCTVSNNTAVANAPVSLTSNAIGYIKNCTISNNTGVKGGGIYCHYSGVYINDSTISDNKATKGGGIYLERICDLYRNFDMENTKVINNIATESGGGILSADDISPEINVMKNCEISGNSAPLYGGGLMVNLHVLGANIVNNNTATGENGKGTDNLCLIPLYSSQQNRIIVDGDLTGSNIHFYCPPDITFENVIQDYNKSGNTTNYANEFFHYEGDGDKYTVIDEDGQFCLKDSPEGQVTHPIIHSEVPKEGIVKLNFDAAFKDEKVKVLSVTPVGSHVFKSIAYNIGGDDIPIEIGGEFTMPDNEAIIKATFKHNNLTKIVGKPATCVEYGWKDYYQCTECGKYFEDANSNILIPDLDVWKEGAGRIERLPHTVRLIKGKAPTCTEYGWKDYYKCTECGKYFEDEDATILIEDLDAWKAGDGKLDKIPHTLRLIKGKAPTCKEDGWKDYYQCKVCGDLFSDAEGKQPIEDLPAWKIGEGKIEKIEHTLKLVKGKAPTCTEDGWKDYYRCSACGDLFMDEAGTKPITNFEEWKVGEGKLPVIAHSLKLVKGKAPTLVEGGYKDYYECPKCHEYFEDKDGKTPILDLEEWKVTKGALGPTLGANNLMIILVVAVAAIITPIIIVVSVNEIKKRRYLRVNNNYLFTDIKYSKTDHPTKPSLDEHIFDFVYQDKHIQYYIFTRKVDKVSEREVKARFQKALNSGKLRKYSERYYKKIYR